MKTVIPFLAFTLMAGCGSRQSETGSATTGSIEVLDEDLNQLLDPDQVPEIIGEGFEWSEGPVWVEEHQFLLFSDIPPNRIYRWKEGEGVTAYLEPSGYTGEESRGGEKGSNGLLISQEGDLLLCQHGDRRIARMSAPVDDPAPRFTTLAGSYEGRRLNSPNDLVQHSGGDLYFTDPPYGLEQQTADSARELDFQGVYRLKSSGELTLLTGELSRPNGLAFSPDEKRLYVANSDPLHAVWMAYDVTDEGTLNNGRIFHDATAQTGEDTGLPDGMKVDADGNIFATGPDGVWIFAPGGKLLGKIKTGQRTSNCAIGNNGKVLYITADMYLLRVELGG